MLIKFAKNILCHVYFYCHLSTLRWARGKSITTCFVVLGFTHSFFDITTYIVASCLPLRHLVIFHTTWATFNVSFLWLALWTLSLWRFWHFSTPRILLEINVFSPVFRFAPFTNRKTHFNLHFPHLPKIFKHDSANYEQLCYIFITDILFFMSINITRFNLPKSLIYKMGNWKHLSVFLHITQPFVSQQPKQAQQKLETHYISALMTDWCSLHIEIIMMSKS